MQLFQITLLFILINFSVSCVREKNLIPKQTSDNPSEIDRAKVAKRKIKEGALVVDVRSKEEFAEDHLPNAINIPHEEIRANLHLLNEDRDSAIVLYCRSGRRSGIAKNVLEISGYTDVTNGGGLEELKALK